MFLTKSNFGISSKKRYKWDTDWRLINCEYGRKLTTDHALVCKKDGFVTQCHNNIQGIIAEICYDLKVEPQLQLLTSERLRKKHSKYKKSESQKCIESYPFCMSAISRKVWYVIYVLMGIFNLFSFSFIIHHVYLCAGFLVLLHLI